MTLIYDLADALCQLVDHYSAAVSCLGFLQVVCPSPALHLLRWASKMQYNKYSLLLSKEGPEASVGLVLRFHS